MANVIEAANSSFAKCIFAKLADKDENIIISPWSLFNALTMTYVGARGNTALQMAKVLGLSNDPEDEGVLEAMRMILEKINEFSQVEYVAANKIWVHSAFKIFPDYEKVLEKYFFSKNGCVDFVTECEKARMDINSWVEKQTNSKIKDLIATGVLDSLTRLVLTSAVYFKGQWLNAFLKNNTTSKKFYVNESRPVKVQMMYMSTKQNYRYFETEHYQVLALPYKGKRFTFNLILPRENSGMSKVLNSVLSDESQLEKCISPPVSNREIHISIPQFKFHFDADFKDILQSLGAQDMFSDSSANFEGITDTKPGLKVSSIIQKAFIEVNEEGTEAAAATAAVMKLRCAMPVHSIPLVLNADHPFCFFICDADTKLIVFMGKVIDPS